MINSKYYSKYLKVAPFALAIWRDQEATTIINAYQEFQNKTGNKNKKSDTQKVFNRPLLDVGCGFGEFAGVFFDSQVEVGIDISIEDLIKAKGRNKYKKLIAADARKLPFANNSFATVISVSVLEHIKNPQLAVKEIYRVLRPGGLFIFTVPTLKLNEHLFYPSLFKRLGLKKLSFLYLKYYHKAFKHVSLFSPKKWQEMTKSCGFIILTMQGTFSARLIKFFDITLIPAFPSQVGRWLFGSRMVWALPAKRKILDPLYRYILQDKKRNLGNILVIARK